VGDLLKTEALEGSGETCTGQVLLDNDETRITYFNFGPGEANEWHFHPYDFVVVTFDDGMLESLTTAGAVARIPAKANNYYRVPAGNKHRARNVGGKPIRLVEIEIKGTDIHRSAGNGETVAVMGVPEAIRKLDARRICAMLSGDVETLKGILADDLIYTHSDARSESKAEYLGNISNGALKYHELNISGMEVRTVSTDTAVATGQMDDCFTAYGKERKLRGRFTATWIRAQGAWKCASVHVTAISLN
jgi:quercetin dioxygenase-like cupin family protein/ketosteroid isomerase-like protein